MRHVRTLVAVAAEASERALAAARVASSDGAIPETRTILDPQELRPAWSLPAGAAEGIDLPVEWPGEVTREWAWGDSTGKGVRVCILDSGVDADHPLVGEVQRSVVASVGPDGEVVVNDDTEGDLCGHGTACAGIVRSLAPDCELISVRVLGAGFTGSGGVLLAGLRWAVEQGFDVVNMSLSTTKSQFAGILHELTDKAYFRRRCSSPRRTTCRSRAIRGASPR